MASPPRRFPGDSATPPQQTPVGFAERPDLSSVHRFGDDEYREIKASNEVVIDPDGGGDYRSWEAWRRSSPRSFQRPVCVTFRKGVWHDVPNPRAKEGAIFPGEVPGTGKVVLSSDGDLPPQSEYSSDLSVVPSSASRIYPSQRGELAWFMTPGGRSQALWGFRDNDRDVWFRGLYTEQREGHGNARGMYHMGMPSDASKFVENVQFDRTMWKGQDMSNNRETRKVGFLCGNRIAVFDSYLYNLNAGDSAAAVSAALFGLAGGPWLVYNTHLEAMGHAAYIDGGPTLPASDMLGHDGVFAYCHAYKPLSWHTARFPDYRPKTFFENAGGTRMMIYRTLMENHLAAIDTQPGINVKNKYGPGTRPPGPHRLGPGFHSNDTIVQECWMRRVKEPFSIAGDGYIQRVSIVDVVSEQLGINAEFGRQNYFLVDIGKALEQGVVSPQMVFIEGLTLANATAHWAFHFARGDAGNRPLDSLVLRNSILPKTRYGPYSTTRGGDGAIGRDMTARHDGRSNVIIGGDPRQYTSVRGMFRGCTFPPTEEGLYRDPENGDFRIHPRHRSAGTGAEGRSDPGGADAVIEAIGIRGSVVASRELTP